MVEYGVASSPFRARSESVRPAPGMLPITYGISGLLRLTALGHGEKLNAFQAAAAFIRNFCRRTNISLSVERCHERLRATRGVVLSLASIDPGKRMMTWLGVGNVQGVLVRADAKKEMSRSHFCCERASSVPVTALQPTVLRIVQEKPFFFATDGVRSIFPVTLSARENPQRSADRFSSIMESAMMMHSLLVARLTGINP